MVRSFVKFIFAFYLWKVPTRFAYTFLICKMAMRNDQKILQRQVRISQPYNQRYDCNFSYSSAPMIFILLHTFSWLRNMSQSRLAILQARTLLHDWIKSSPSYALQVHEISFVSHRVLHLCAYGGRDKIVLEFLIKQLKYLHRHCESPMLLQEKLHLYFALLVGAICTNQPKKLRGIFLRRLDKIFANLLASNFNNFRAPKSLLDLTTMLIVCACYV